MGNNTSSSTTPLEKSFESICTPFKDFIRDQKTSNALLILATLLAIYLANSQWSSFYTYYNNAVSGLYISNWSIEMTNQQWINDGLMAFFFYVIGLELKKEILAGQLTSLKTNITILMAALGGMIVPALIYYSLNANQVGAQGWGIPMATDTAFAVGVLALLGRRIPIAATTFLTALAIFDDLGAVLVIAFYYIEEINVISLYQAAIVFTLMLFINRLGVRQTIPYIIGGLLLWFTIHASGVHASISGILAAMTIPAKPKHKPVWFIKKILHLLRKFKYIERHTDQRANILSKQKEHEVISDIERVAETSTTPLQRWENTVKRPISLFVLPLFALSNAGIPVNTESLPYILNSPVFWGIFLGLVLGKSLGIVFFTWIIIKSGFGFLPKGITLSHVFGIGLLGGMGFTMSIFIAGISLNSLGTEIYNAKTAILFASLIAGILGYSWMYWHTRKVSDHG